MKDNAGKDKAMKVMREIRKKENKYRDKRIFCEEHNFPLEAQKFKFAEDILMRTIWQIESIFETESVSYYEEE